MKIILAFDKFKASMTSEEAAKAAERGILAAFSDHNSTKTNRGIPYDPEIVVLPTADGGEGTVDAFLCACGGERVVCNVTPPHLDPSSGKTIQASYGVIADSLCKDRRTAVMEMSASSGLTLVPEARRNPLYTSTFGTGEMIRHALDRGIRHFLLGLGGSATNDGGCGMAAALGARFRSRRGTVISNPRGIDLCELTEIDLGSLDPRLADCTFTACCDVGNPLCGETGAAAVYAPQKGAAPADIPLLDRGLAQLADLLLSEYGTDIASVPGSGAAGGMGGGVLAFLRGRLVPGIDAVLDAARFSEHIRNADLLLSGEGRLDRQTVYGKTVCGLLERAKAADVPVLLFGGCVENDASALYSMGAAGIFALCDRPMPATESMARAEALLEARVRAAVGCFLAGKTSFRI
ncbi:MAG: glycerate kinase [Eubacteriales bacterium]